MMRSLFSGVSGLKTHQTRMDVIGNNIANVNTTAYKSKSINFSDMLYQTTQSATAPSSANGTAGTNPRQIGLGVKTGAISTSITTEGSNQSTGNPFDIKLTGEAFFIVTDGTNRYFTRDGSFDVDSDGNLCMANTGYIVEGWTRTDSETGAIVQDTVSPISVLSSANSTYPAAATTKATISGILDKNDDNLETSNGKIINVQTLDALGYEYNVKFGITPTQQENRSTRALTNTETQYDLTNTLYKLDTSDITYTYTAKDGTTKTLTETSSPELMAALNKAVWAYVLDNTQNAGTSIDGSHTFGANDSGITINVGTFVNNYNGNNTGNTLNFPEASELTSVTLTASFSGGTAYTTDKSSATYPLSENVATTVISDDVVNQFYSAAGTTPTDGVIEYTLGNMPSVTAVAKSYVDDDDKTVTNYTFRDVATSSDITGITSDMSSDVLKLLSLGQEDTNSRSVYTTTESVSAGMTATPGQYTISLIGMTDSDGNEVDISSLSNVTTSWDLVYNTADGSFSYVDTSGSNTFTLNLSALGTQGNFSNIEFDISNTTNENNGGKSTISGLKDDGRKVGTMSGVSIANDGVITASYTNGMQRSIGQIAVATFANSMGLENVGDNLYETTTNSGEFDGVGVDIKASGTGYMTTGVLEMSNVDLATEFTNMITTQRGFQANSRIITTSDTLLEELVNLKR